MMLCSKGNNRQYEEIEQIIKAIKYIISYKRMALSNAGFLISLDDQCFRDTPDIFGTLQNIGRWDNLFQGILVLWNVRQSRKWKRNK